MRKLSKTHQTLILIAVLIVLAILFVFWQNNSLVISEHDYINESLPSDFDGFKIAHISDLHNKSFGKDQIRLLEKLKGVSPDMIVITGDLIDRRKYDLDLAMMFIEGAVDVAPVYYVSGNHEAWSGEFSLIKESLLSAGVSVLDNEKLKITKGHSWIDILGVSDPDFLTSSYIDGTNISDMSKKLEQWSAEQGFKILLSHRPELLDLYSHNKMDLIFTGHAHGGQFRIPLMGGLVAPDQGLFPEFTSGLHIRGSSTMFISRGLGNSIVPIRIFNRPEIIAVTLKSNPQ